MNPEVPVKKLIVYRFKGKDDRMVEVPFVVPEGVTSYYVRNLMVSLEAHARLEHPEMPRENTVIENMVITQNEDTTYVDGTIRTPPLQIFALSYNIVSIRDGRMY